jgi:preprotein translocase subunit SecY
MWHNYPVFFLSPGVKLILAALIIWSLVWKGFALWKAARNSHTAWYVIMLIVNTAGILEIIYIFGFSNKGQKNLPPMSGQ